MYKFALMGALLIIVGCADSAEPDKPLTIPEAEKPITAPQSETQQLFAPSLVFIDSTNSETLKEKITYAGYRGPLPDPINRVEDTSLYFVLSDLTLSQGMLGVLLTRSRRISSELSIGCDPVDRKLSPKVRSIEVDRLTLCGEVDLSNLVEIKTRHLVFKNANLKVYGYRENLLFFNTDIWSIEGTNVLTVKTVRGRTERRTVAINSLVVLATGQLNITSFGTEGSTE